MIAERRPQSSKGRCCLLATLRPAHIAESARESTIRLRFAQSLPDAPIDDFVISRREACREKAREPSGVIAGCAADLFDRAPTPHFGFAEPNVERPLLGGRHGHSVKIDDETVG